MTNTYYLGENDKWKPQGVAKL